MAADLLESVIPEVVPGRDATRTEELGLDETGTEVEGLVFVAMTGTDDCEFTALPLERGALVC